MKLGIMRRAAQAPEPVALPADVLAAVENVSVLVRPGSDENEPRVFIQWPGAAIQGWLYSPELSADVLKKTYPELNDNQVARACRALAGLVAQKMREPSPFIAPRRNWVKDF